jgi:hypothetical protein
MHSYLRIQVTPIEKTIFLVVILGAIFSGLYLYVLHRRGMLGLMFSRSYWAESFRAAGPLTRIGYGAGVLFIPLVLVATVLGPLGLTQVLIGLYFMTYGALLLTGRIPLRKGFDHLWFGRGVVLFGVSALVFGAAALRGERSGLLWIAIGFALGLAGLLSAAPAFGTWWRHHRGVR